MTLMESRRARATEERAVSTGRPRPRRRGWRRWILSGPLLVVLAILILAPAAFVVVAAFTTESPRPGASLGSFTWSNFAILRDPGFTGGLLNSVLIAVFGTVLALVIGGGLAFLAARSDVFGRRFVFLVGVAPLVLPSYVGALAWSMLGSPQAGLLNVALRDLGLPPVVDLYGVGGMVFVLALFYAPYPFLMIHSALSLMNPELEDAAATHGASVRKILGRITFPLALPALLGSGLLVFILTLENFPVAQVLATPGGVVTLPTFLFQLMTASPARGNEASAIAIALVVIVSVVTLLQRRALAKRSFTTVTGKGVRARRVGLGRGRAVCFALACLYFVLSIVAPVLALLLTSVRRSPYMDSFAELLQPGALRFDAYADVLQSRLFATVTLNSVVVSVVAAVAGTVIAFLVAYTTYRTTARGGGLLEGISMTPIAIPAIVLGIGLLWTWIQAPIPLYGTLGVLMIAFVAAQMPQGLRSVASAIRATDRDLEDGAVVHGAPRGQAVALVTLPLMRVALSSTLLLLLMLSMRELTVPLFLYTSNTQILSITIFDQFENGGALREAAVLSVVYVLIMFVLSYLPRRFGGTPDV